MFTEKDEYWLQQAIFLAEKARVQDEIPVGAVLVYQDEVVGEGYNAPITKQDPTAHAEMIALREGALKLNNYRLIDTTLYVTLEPCLMCAGALIHSRIKRLVFGAFDLKAGAIVSQAMMLNLPFLNHKIDYQGGCHASACKDLLRKFFKEKRKGGVL